MTKETLPMKSHLELTVKRKIRTSLKKLIFPSVLIALGFALLAACSLSGYKHAGGPINPINWVDGTPDPSTEPMGKIQSFTELLKTWGWITLVLAFAFKPVRQPVTRLWVVVFKIITIPFDTAYEFYTEWKSKRKNNRER